MTWEAWLIAISIGLAALAFVALAVFVILAFVSLRQMVNDLDQKVHQLDPLFRLVSKAGRILEKKVIATQVAAEKAATQEEAEHTTSRIQETGHTQIINTAVEVAEWLATGLVLWQKIKERR